MENQQIESRTIVTATFHETDRRKRLGRYGRHTVSWQDSRELWELCASFWDRIETDDALISFSVSRNGVEVCERSREWFLAPGALDPIAGQMEVR